MNMLYEAKQNQEASMLEVTKNGIRLCADTAMLIGQTNFEILSFRRAKVMPELNYSYRQLSFDQGDHPKLLKANQRYVWCLQFQKSHLLLVVPYQYLLINLYKIKSSLLFCTGAAGHQDENLGSCRVSRTRTIKIPGNSRANGTNATTRITTKKQSRIASTL